MSLSFTPEQKQTWLWLAVGLAIVALLVLLGPVLTPFIAAAILAYALNPAVDHIASKRIGKSAIPRPVAVMVVLLLLLSAILALMFIVVPVLQKEIPLLHEKLPDFLVKLDATAGSRLRGMGLNVQLDSVSIEQHLSQQFAASGNEIWTAILGSLKVGGMVVLGWIGTFLLLPVVLFYLLLDWHALLLQIKHSVPRRWVGRAMKMTQEVNTLLAQYLRGQLVVMLALAVYYSVALALAGLDVAWPIGILTGLLVCIPYLGFGLGLILALIAAMLQFDGWYGLIAVGSIYAVGQMIEGFYLTPRLVGERIGLSPLAVIFALMAFGQLFGFAGVLLALPAAAIVSVALKHLHAHYLASSFYKQA